jgi:hypothetical protein
MKGSLILGQFLLLQYQYLKMIAEDLNKLGVSNYLQKIAQNQGIREQFRLASMNEIDMKPILASLGYDSEADFFADMQN